MSDFAKSIKEIFEERISSPFYGTLIVSWLICNWKIPYVTFFVDGDKLKVDKIEYLIDNCSNNWHLFVFPALSTAFILLALPYVTNGAYWVTLKFDSWRIRMRNEIENKQLLSVEQSVRLRMEMQTIQEKFTNVVNLKDEEMQLQKNRIQLQDDQIKEYATQISTLEKELTSEKNNVLAVKSEIEVLNGYINKTNHKPQPPVPLHLRRELINFLRNENYRDSFAALVDNLRNKNNIREYSSSALNPYTDLGLIRKSDDTIMLTEKGAKFYNELQLWKANNLNS